MMLAELQRDFGAWLKSAAPPAFGRQAEPGLRVYQNNYRAQLVGCLEASFPRTLSWIGGEAFHAAVVTHVERVPPSSWTLDAYPRDFPETLRQLYPADPEIGELADLERALEEAFVGPDAEPVYAATAANVDWDRAVLRLVPTLDLIEAGTNAALIHVVLVEGETPPRAELLPEVGTLLIWRHGFVARFRRIDAAERQGLLLVRAGTSFASLCASLVASYGEAEGVALAGAWLGRWLADGLIVDITEGAITCASPS